ncbi:FGLLP motif-containing membrane protein [Yinghuangia sp. YIM S09857]|uniref:FGLLP motif-containing membrane protein n=1 Tax=Yinghuangia sp. YIM S09857 TaxID=3436929 RepID=UPI003F5299A3
MAVASSRADRWKKATLVAAAAGVLLVFSAPAATAAPKRTIILVVDTSDSMNEATGDGQETRLTEAKAALRSTIGSLGDSDRVGLHEFSGECGDGGDLLVEPGTGNRGQLRDEVEALQTGGRTPTPDAIRKAASEFPDDSSEKILILVSDGESSCNEDPCEVVVEVQEQTGIKFVAHTVGFQTSEQANTELSCIADTTGGQYFAAEDQQGITDSLEQALLPVVGDDVSTVLNALPMPSDVPLDPESVAKTAGLAAGLVLLIGFPAELFNRTIEENQRRISRWWRRRGGGAAGAGGPNPAAGGSGPFPPDGGAGMNPGPGGAGGGLGGGTTGLHASDGGAASGGTTGLHASDAGGMTGQHAGGGAYGPGGFAGPDAGAGGAGAAAYGPGGAAGMDPGAGGGAGAAGGFGGAQASGGGAYASGSGAYGASGGAGGFGAAGGSGAYGASGGVAGGSGAFGTAGGSGAYGAAAVPGRSLWASPWILPVFVVISALASTFVDPDSGFNAKSGILLLGFLVAAPLVIFAYSWPNEQNAKRASGVPGALKTVPAALGLAVFCTVLSRLSDFVPGYVFGLVLGYVALRERRLSRAQEGKGVLFGAICALLLSVGAWVGLEFVHEKAIAVDANAGLVIADTILGTTFILGVETVLFGLIPLRVLDGNKLRKWNTWIWAATYTVAILLFVHVLVLNSGRGGSDNETSLTAALVLFAGFALVSGLFWAYFKYVPDPALMPAPVGMPTGMVRAVPPRVPPQPAPPVPPMPGYGAPPVPPPGAAPGATPAPPSGEPYVPAPGRPPMPPPVPAVPPTPAPPTMPPPPSGPPTTGAGHVPPPQAPPTPPPPTGPPPGTH